MQDIGFVHYWWTARLQGGRGVVREGQRGAGRALVAAVAGGDDAGRGRRSAVVAPDVGGDPRSRRKSTGCATMPSGGWPSSTRSTPSTQLQQIVDTAAVETAGRRPTGTAVARCHAVRGIPLDPDRARRTRSIPAGRVALSPQSPLFPLPDEPQRLSARRLHERPASTLAAGVFGAVIGSFLNVCIYRLPLGEVGRLAGVGLPHCGAPAGLVREHPGRQLPGAAAAAAGPAGAHLRALSDRRGADGADVRRGLVVVRPEPAAGRRGWSSAAR